MQPPDVLLNAYHTATESWMAEAVSVGHSVFRRLAALEVVVFGLIVALRARGAGAEAVIPELAWKLFLIALLLTALLLYPLWMPTITPSFTQVAGEITGFSTLNPVLVVRQGIALGLLVLTTAMFSGWLMPEPIGILVGGLAALGIILAFITVAAIITKTLIESWIVLAAGPFFLGFSPFRLTAQIADNFIVYATQVGIRLFFLILLLSAARGAALSWAESITVASIFDLQLVFELLAASLILATALWTIPGRVAEVLTRSWQLGIRQGLGT